MTTYLIQFLTGLSHAATLFLVASGLSIIFGVTRIVNFAHGAFYMLGAYLAYSISQLLMATIGTAAGFWIGILAAALCVGAIGVLMELVLLRRIYRAPELFQLLATFGVVLVVEDAVRWLWGPEDLLSPRAPGFRGTVEILGQRFPLRARVLSVFHYCHTRIGSSPHLRWALNACPIPHQDERRSRLRCPIHLSLDLEARTSQRECIEKPNDTDTGEAL